MAGGEADNEWLVSAECWVTAVEATRCQVDVVGGRFVRLRQRAIGVRPGAP